MDEEKADVSTVQQRVLCRSRTLTRSREMIQIDKTYMFSNTLLCTWCVILLNFMEWRLQVHN